MEVSTSTTCLSDHCPAIAGSFIHRCALHLDMDSTAVRHLTTMRAMGGETILMIILIGMDPIIGPHEHHLGSWGMLMGIILSSPMKPIILTTRQDITRTTDLIAGSISSGMLVYLLDHIPLVHWRVPHAPRTTQTQPN